MAAQSGRDLLVLKNATAIAGLRETSVTANAEPVDITGKGSSGYRTLASFSGVESVDISASGVFLDDVLRDIAFAGTGTSKLLTDITLSWGDGATLSGDFFFASYEGAGNHDGEETYDVSMQSSGAWVYTPSV